MTKRTVTAVLWLLAVWTVGNIAATFAGIPSVIGPAAGLLAAGFVWWDPAGWFWTKPADRARVARRLADLPRVSEAESAAAVRHEPDTAHG